MSLDEIQRESLLPVIQEGIDFYKHELRRAQNDLRWLHERDNFFPYNAPENNDEKFMTLRPGAPVRAPSDPINWDDYEYTAESAVKQKRAQEDWEEDIREFNIECEDAWKRESEAEAALEELYSLRELMHYRPPVERRSPALLAWWRAHHTS